MSGAVKKHHTEIRIGTRKPRFYAVTREISNSVEKLLKQYLVSNEKRVSPDEVFKEINQKFSKVGNIVTGFRLRDGLTQVQLAKKIKTSQPTIAAIENGSRTVGKTLASKLAKVFKTNYKLFLNK